MISGERFEDDGGAFVGVGGVGFDVHLGLAETVGDEASGDLLGAVGELGFTAEDEFFGLSGVEWGREYFCAFGESGVFGGGDGDGAGGDYLGEGGKGGA